MYNSEKHLFLYHEQGEDDMIVKNMEFLTSFDPEVGNAVKAEYDRQCRNIELIASENFVSPAVLAAVGLMRLLDYLHQLR